jgi:probable F420-dependent oxidoreductase
MPVATGIVPIWAAPPEVLAASWHRIEARHPDRLLLGIGTSHPERWGVKAASPHDELVTYLDGLEAAGVPKERMVLAALGPRTLRLAVERTAGAHPFLVPTSHTREARALIGPDALLAPEQRVVLEADADRARAIARPTVQTPYLGLSNYRRNLQRLGWSEADLDDGGSDALIDALVVHGDDAAVAAGIRAQLDAGADHVTVQLLDADEAGYARLATALGLAG